MRNEYDLLNILTTYNHTLMARLLFSDNIQTFLKKPDTTAMRENKELDKWISEYIKSFEKQLPF